MSKKNMFYKYRRIGQVMAYRITSPEFVSRLYFKHELGYKLDLKNPKTFNEKLQWLKLYYWPRCEKAIKCADKYQVRNYIKSFGKEEILNDILYAWESVEEINWSKLPSRFVIKCNHGCGYNIICKDKSKLNEIEVKKTLKKWMNENFGEFNAEPHYDEIPKKIICEKFLEGNIINYNIYVFNGKVIFFSVAGGLGDGVGEHLTYYNRNGTIADFKNKNYPTKQEKLTELLPDMIKMAEFLSKDFPMVRVDLFDVKGKIILSELTFTPGGALIPFDSYEADLKLGNQLDISFQMANVNKIKIQK